MTRANVFAQSFGEMVKRPSNSPSDNDSVVEDLELVEVSATFGRCYTARIKVPMTGKGSAGALLAVLNNGMKHAVGEQ